MWNIFLTWLATTVVGELLRPKPKFNTPQPSALGDFQAPTAEYGRAVPVAYGECYLKAPNVVWYGDLGVEAITEKVKTGWFSSKRATRVYKYYLGMQLVFCKAFSRWELEHGSGLVELRFDDRRPTAVADRPVNVIAGTVQKYSASYKQSYVYPAGSDSIFTRVEVIDDNLFGGQEKEGGVSGTIDFFFGHSGTTQSDYLQRVFGTNSVPAYRGYTHAVLRKCYVGTTKYLKTVGAVVRRYPWFWADGFGFRIGNDANPIAVVVDLMSNPDYGLGVSRERFGASFRQAALQCHAESMGISMTFDTRANARDMFSEVLRHIDAVMYEDPTTGLYEVSLARADYSVSTLLTLDPDNVLELELTRPSWSETKNVVRVQYVNAANNFTQAVVELQNSANIAVRGGEKSIETFNFMGLSNSSNAMKVAERILRTVSYPLARISLKATRAAFELRPGSVFALDWPELGVSGMSCRVTRISYGSLDDPAITIDAVEDIFGTLTTQFTAPPDSAWTNPVTALSANAAEALVEAPFALMGSEQRGVMTLAARSSQLAQGYVVLSDPAGALTQTAEVSAFTPTGRLTADVSAADASLTLTATIDVAAMPALTAAQQRAGEYLLAVNDELMTFKQATLNPDGTYTFSGLGRGVLDTLPRTHNADSRAWVLSAAAGLLQEASYPADATLNAKLLPFDSTRQLEAEDAALLSITTTSRAFKPYPPGRLRLNGQVNPAAVSGDAVLSWKHRGKAALLAANAFVSHEENVSYADANVSYVVTAYIDDVQVRQATVSSESYTYTAAMRAADDADLSKQVVLRVKAVADTYESEELSTAAFIMS